jgi:hypothetical protein
VPVYVKMTVLFMRIFIILPSKTVLLEKYVGKEGYIKGDLKCAIPL